MLLSLYYFLYCNLILFWFSIWLLPSSLLCTQLYEDNTIVRRFPVFSIALLMSHAQNKIPTTHGWSCWMILGERSFSTDSAVQLCMQTAKVNIGCPSYYRSSGVNAHLQIHTSTLMLTSCLGSSMKKCLFRMLVERILMGFASFVRCSVFPPWDST